MYVDRAGLEGETTVTPGQFCRDPDPARPRLHPLLARPAVPAHRAVGGGHRHHRPGRPEQQRLTASWQLPPLCRVCCAAKPVCVLDGDLKLGRLRACWWNCSDVSWGAAPTPPTATTATTILTSSSTPTISVTLRMDAQEFSFSK